VFGKVQVKFT